MSSSTADGLVVKVAPIADRGHRHAVQFYESDEFLCATLADLVAAAGAQQQPALVIATVKHLKGLQEVLTARGSEPDRLLRSGRLVLQDARALLAEIQVDGKLEGGRFEQVALGLLDRARGRDRTRAVAVYGEVVDLLCEDGRPEAARRLEEMWNDLARRTPFSLHCGYALERFASASETVSFMEICRLHDEVVPTERFTNLDESGRLAEISALQQRARALETELLHRRELETQLRAALEEQERLLELEREARADAEAADRARSDFLAVMSHELRTPLNAIAGYADLLDLGIHGPISEAQRDSIDRIQRSQRHLLGLIDSVLAYSRMEAGAVHYSVEPLRMLDVLGTADVCVLPQMEEKGLHFISPSPGPEMVAHADREKVERILINLLVNAIKFTAPGGEIELRCEALDGSVRLRVRDTGIGIREDQLESVFQPFVQVDNGLTRTQSGVGLGLAISRELARGMGGDLTVVSTPGVGSTFTLTLPLAQGRP
jgi:signal transduction histidine kinase